MVDTAGALEVADTSVGVAGRYGPVTTTGVWTGWNILRYGENCLGVRVLCGDHGHHGERGCGAGSGGGHRRWLGAWHGW